jgi:hypothetical protein
MSKISASPGKLAVAAAGAALLAACATLDPGVAWNIPPAGSSWQIAQQNTGSYGKDVTYQVTRGEALWQGKQAVTLTNSGSGSTIMATPDGKWMAAVNREGKTLVTWDPPIGYVYPLKVGQNWTTQHKMTGPNGATDITFSCKVEDRERVTVPAGTFDTLRIVCESPVSRDVSWSIVDLGMHAKQEFNRLPNHPQGAGTQKNMLLSVKRSS